MAPAIPRKIHQIWLGPEMPPEYAAYSRRFQELHPDWEYKLWRDEDLDWLAHRAEFDFFPHAATKADIARYEIVERFGGFYFDTDFEPMKPLDPLLGRATMIVCPEVPDQLANGFFAATPHHPIMKYVLQTLRENARANSDGTSMQIAGPEFFTRAVRRGAEITGEDCLWLPRHSLYPYSPGQVELASLPEAPATYAVHRWAGSWVAAPRRPKKPRSRANRALESGMKRFVTRTASKVQKLVPRQAPHHGAVSIGNGHVLMNVGGEFPLIVRSDDLGLLPSVFMGRRPEDEYVNFLRKSIRGPDHIVEIGANVGHTILAAARRLGRQGRIDAFEPVHDVAQLLKDNVYMNRAAAMISCDIAVHEVAIGSADGEGTIAVPLRHSARASLRPDAAERLRAEGLAVDQRPVTVKTFGAALPGLHHAKLVRIDVEGLEADVLRSVRPAIADGRIDYVDVAVMDGNLGATWSELEALLVTLRDEHGAAFHALAPDGGTVPIALERVLNGPPHKHLIIDFATSRHRQ